MTAKKSGPFGIAPHSGTFGMVPAQLVFDQRLSAEAKLVYAALACHADHTGYCYPKQIGLAAAIGVRQQTISQHLVALTEKKWIVPDWTIMEGRRRHCYRLRFQPHRTGGTGTARTSGACTSGADTSGACVKNIPVVEQKNVHVQSAVSRLVGVEHTLANAVQAATPRGSGEVLTHPPEAHPLFAAACAAVGHAPRGDGQRKLWTRILGNLERAGVTPDDLPRMARTWHRVYPQARLTLPAMDLHLGELLPAPTPAPARAPERPPVHVLMPAGLAPVYADWCVTLPLQEQANYHARPMIGFQNYKRWCLERGLEPRP